MGLKAHHDGVKPANSLEWRSGTTSEMEANINLMVQLKERIVAP